MFNKILIANRGEIAVRVIRACRELGITSAAVYSEADKRSPHIRFADEAYFIGEPQASDSYLNKEKLISLAEKIGADAIHPGYGFFSENADFIEAVEKKKITFIGPSSSAVRLIGSKTAARELMKKNGVPIVPGTTKPISSVEEGIDAAKEIGFPILLKASAGGGGKGMRKIYEEKEFESAYDATRRESLKAFGDDAIYIEKFIESPKHIEVQIIADKQGNYAHLFERECSMQRRHQKIIEEAPSSFVDKSTREKITNAAISAAKACNYVNAGTIEFLMDREKNFYFLEMNTRIQVEHPVTEFITGIDLVKEQISVAAGNSLSFMQEELSISGHAVECRIYAEDFENNFLPSTGKIIHYKAPSGAGVRVDSGIGNGSEVSVYYDPLLAKLVCWGSDREAAIKRMSLALKEYSISGVTTNIPSLLWLIGHERFKNGDFDINFVEKEFLPLIAEKLEKDLSNLEDAACIISVLLKAGATAGNVSNHSESNNNKWNSLLYE